MVVDGISIDVQERRSDGIIVYTVLLNDWVYLITRNKKLIEKFKKKR
jgi:hypothetical protein